jgi:hypothetical protein
MSTREFTVDICEALYTCPKRIVSKLQWVATRNNTFMVQAQVMTEEGDILDLAGHWCLRSFDSRRRWGFSLRYYGHVVRSFDMAKSHKNPGEPGRVKGPHKHRFKSSKIPRYAYKPNPPISDTEPNQSLMDFLAEANISPPTDYQNLMFP